MCWTPAKRKLDDQAAAACSLTAVRLLLPSSAAAPRLLLRRLVVFVVSMDAGNYVDSSDPPAPLCTSGPASAETGPFSECARLEHRCFARLIGLRLYSCVAARNGSMDLFQRHRVSRGTGMAVNGCSDCGERPTATRNRIAADQMWLEHSKRLSRHPVPCSEPTTRP